MSSLLEITGQESGIVIYDDEVMVVNWASFTVGLPFLLPPFGFVIELPFNSPLEVVKEYYVDDVREVLPGTILSIVEDDEMFLMLQGMNILYDLNGDIPALWGYDVGLGTVINTDDKGNFAPTPGKVYHVNNAVIIAPYGWN